MRARRFRVVATAAGVGLFLALAPGVGSVAGIAGADPIPPPGIVPSGVFPSVAHDSWPTYGHDVHHTFSTKDTHLSPSNVQGLVPRWFFPTDDAVTANPIVVNGTVYVGSWDGRFYAVDAATGAKVWQYSAKCQPAVDPPAPGCQPAAQAGSRPPGDDTSDGGLITSSAYFLKADPGAGRPDDLVIFGGGYTLYALRAADGTEWFPPHDYPGTGVGTTAVPTVDQARIFSSPVVVGNQILFGVTSDGQDGHRGYFVSADLTTGNKQWVFETDVDNNGVPQNDGCGGVWSSPTIDETDSLAVFDVADCHFFGNHNKATPPVSEPYNERVIALDIATGAKKWVFTPPRLDPNSPEYNGDPDCDWDFGATANFGKLPGPGGGTAFLGVGGKDGTYYSLDPKTGALRWHTNVVYGGLAGGFIATTALDEKSGHTYGATALGDFGRFEGVGSAVCQPGNPSDLPIQEPSMYSFDASSGQVAWSQPLSQSFAPTTVAGGMTFVGSGLAKHIQIRDAATGLLLKALPLEANNDSGIAVGRDTIYFGTGSSEQGTADGVMAWSLPAALTGG